MQMKSVRPRIQETAYRLFDRPLHPELFTPAIVGHIKTQLYSLDVGLCDGGHFIRFRSARDHIFELTGPSQSSLISTGLIQSEAYAQNEAILIETMQPVEYHYAGEVDTVDAHIFTRVELELEMEAKGAFLSHQFPSHNRLFPGPLSLAKVEGTATSVTIHTFHTFPRDLSVLRTQTLIDIGRKSC